MSDPLARPLWRGRTNVDAMTIAAIEAAEVLAGHEFLITQGSYQSTVAASAGTHDRGGVVDIRWTGDNEDIRALRLVGFWAWHRKPSQGPWPDHVHAVLKGHPFLADSAARQITSGEAGRNGLANNGPDDGPHVTVPTFQWPPVEEFLDMDARQAEALFRKVVREELGSEKHDVGKPNEWSEDTIFGALLKQQRETVTLLKEIRDGMESGPKKTGVAVGKALKEGAPNAARGRNA